MEAYKAGHRDFGENYVQELLAKRETLPQDIRWHFIGHLQSNKVKYIVPFVYLIHGVDSLKLLKEISKQSAKAGRTTDVLLQVHVAREETKFGFSPGEIGDALEAAAEFPAAKVRGFMAMASNTQDLEQVRGEFMVVRDLKARFESHWPDLRILSYGMSGDYREAVACGSNMVRIGSLIFGERNYR